LMSSAMMVLSGAAVMPGVIVSVTAALVLIPALALIPVLALILILALIIRRRCFFSGQRCDAIPDLPHGHSPDVFCRNVRVQLFQFQIRLVLSIRQTCLMGIFYFSFFRTETVGVMSRGTGLYIR